VLLPRQQWTPASGAQHQANEPFRSASIDGGEVTLWVDVVEKGLVIFGEQ
jgi:hypothetical protein